MRKLLSIIFISLSFFACSKDSNNNSGQIGGIYTGSCTYIYQSVSNNQNIVTTESASVSGQSGSYSISIKGRIYSISLSGNTFSSVQQSSNGQTTLSGSLTASNLSLSAVTQGNGFQETLTFSGTK